MSSGVSTPLFSVIVPTYNRPESLRLCLESLARLEYPRDHFEVIVVDDGSPQRLDAVIEPFGRHLRADLVSQQNAGPAAARNAGARCAAGRYLAFTDDDCRPEPDWLAAILARLTASPNSLVSGRRRTCAPRSLSAEASQTVADAAYSYYQRFPERGQFVSTSNLAVPVDRFHALGGFDARFRYSEDRDFGARWREAGFSIIYAPEAVVCHDMTLTLKALWQRHFEFGRGAFLYHEARRARTLPQFRPDARFYRELFRRPARESGWPRALLLVALVGVAQAANTLGYWSERLSIGRSGRRGQ